MSWTILYSKIRCFPCHYRTGWNRARTQSTVPKFFWKKLKHYITLCRIEGSWILSEKKIALPFHHMHIITYTGVLVCDLLNVLLQMVKVDFFWFGLYQVTTITICPACWVVHRIVSKFGLNHQTKNSYWENRGHKILWSFTHTPSGFQQQQKQNTYVLSR